MAAFVEEADAAVQFLVCRDESPIGHIVLMNLDMQASTAELGWLVITPDEQGNGFATEAGPCVSSTPSTIEGSTTSGPG